MEVSDDKINEFTDFYFEMELQLDRDINLEEKVKLLAKTFLTSIKHNFDRKLIYI